MQHLVSELHFSGDAYFTFSPGKVSSTKPFFVEQLANDIYLFRDDEDPQITSGQFEQAEDQDVDMETKSTGSKKRKRERGQETSFVKRLKRSSTMCYEIPSNLARSFQIHVQNRVILKIDSGVFDAFKQGCLELRAENHSCIVVETSKASLEYLHICAMDESVIRAAETLCADSIIAATFGDGRISKLTPLQECKCFEYGGRILLNMPKTFAGIELDDKVTFFQKSQTVPCFQN